MPQTDTVNRRIVLAARPKGTPTPNDFRVERTPVPTPSAGQVLLRTSYLSLDPYMRGRMSEGPSYAPALTLGEVMVGGTVSRVVASMHPEFREGDLVLGNAGWQDYALSSGQDLMPVGDATHPSYALGALGMPGFTAYYGLLALGEPKPGETVVVGAATGAVGAIVGQIAKLKGARVVGVASGAIKCLHAVEDLDFDACLDRRDPRLAEQLAAACPEGIDVYFESVGGRVFDAVLPLLNDGARVPVCGVIAHYNDTGLSPAPDRLPRLMSLLVYRRIRMQGYIILDHYAEHFAAFLRDMRAWVAAGSVTLREDVVDGLENAPAAFIGLLEGRNFGKLLVRVASA